MVLAPSSLSRRFLVLGFLCVLVDVGGFARSVGAQGSKASPTSRPNILFVFTDDHSARAISAYGSRINRTPNIDRIAREGMRFDRCFCTNAICAPSRAVILTGKHSHLNGHRDNRVSFDGDQLTFPKLMRRSGYQTAVVGKWHLRSTPTGFDHYEVLRGQGPYYNPVLRTPDGEKKHVGYTTDIITDRALDFLDRRDAERPFMLMYQHKAPHRNWQPGPKHLTLYDDVQIPEPATLFDDYTGRERPAREQEMTIAEHLFDFDLKFVAPNILTPEQRKVWDAAYGPKNEAFKAANLKGRDLVRWKYQRYIKDYLRCVASVDDNLGRVLDYLDASGLAKNTIVVYSSDQGWFLGEHGWYDKRWMYDESLTMPFIVRWPGVVAPGSSNDDFASNLDFAPTFLDIAGVEAPKAMQGRSLVPLLHDRTPPDWRTSFYYHYYEHPGAHMVHRHDGVRTRRYKLIHYYRIDTWELFDLKRDPDEISSVYHDPSYAGVARWMHAELVRLRKHYRVGESEFAAK